MAPESSSDPALPPAVPAARSRAEAELVTPRQRRVLTQLDDRARRTELLAALAGAGGLDHEHTGRVLCAELGELETSAREVGLDGMVAMARALRRVVDHLGGGRPAPRPQRDAIVLDDDEITRDLIALALQAEGHRVRSAGSVAELAYFVSERRPDVLLTDAHMPDAPGVRFCSYLRRAIALENIPIVMFASAHGDELARLAHEAGADLYLSKDQGIADLMSEVARLFDDILW
jgi:CheY-like chemotaxis protein